MTRTKIFLMSLSLLLAGAPLTAGTAVINLRTESMQTPVGIDESRPYFSWQMSSDRIGAAQKAYRIVVADSREGLASGDFVFDSGLVRSDESLNIQYAGAALRASTRYFWRVSVTDETGSTHDSEPTWFETGLMGSGWSGAQWIGSEKVGASKYRTFFNIDYDVRIPEGSRRAVFAYSVKDKDNYITVGLDISGKPSLSVDYAVEGDRRHLSTIDVSGLITPENSHASHHLTLKVSTPGYHLKSNLIVLLDGEMLRPVEGVPGGPARENVSSGNPFQMVITPYPGGERVHDWARLHSIGFLQPKGQKAEFSNITISEDNWARCSTPTRSVSMS